VHAPADREAPISARGERRFPTCDAARGRRDPSIPAGRPLKAAEAASAFKVMGRFNHESSGRRIGAHLFARLGRRRIEEVEWT
jgi:hypothetical protein